MLQFVWSYYRNCYRKGYRLDIWHYNLLVYLFVIHIMLPFDRGDLNAVVLGPMLLRRAQANMNEAYFVSAFGYLCILLGGELWRIRLDLGIRAKFASLIEIPARLALVLLQSRRLLIVHGIVALTLIAGVLAFYFKTEGFGFNLRGLLLVNPTLRAVSNFVSFYSALIGSYCLARFFRFKERSMLLTTVLISAGLIFFGARGLLAGLFSLAIVIYLIELRTRLRFAWLAAILLGAVGTSILLDALRSSNFSVGTVSAGFLLSIFYGNSYSDTRDFALILSFWDHQLFWGKTFLAGLIAFVPRFVSSFREMWSLGVVTASMAGFSPQEHPGLRVGLFGEGYLNFGLVGVAFIGLFVGAATRLIDLRVKQSLSLLPASGLLVYSYIAIGLIVGVAINSTGASSFYTIMLIFLVSWFVLRLAKFLNIPLS